MHVIVDNLVTNYHKIGNGPTVLLLHGWGDNLNTYKSLAQELQTTYTVVALDLPGFGGTEVPNKAFNLELYARFVASFLEKIGSFELHAVIGHSNGGAVAIKALSSGIVESKKLILLASSGVRSTQKTSKKAKRLLVKLLKIPTKILPTSTQNKIKRKVYEKIGSDLFVAEHLQETFKLVIEEDLVEVSRNIHQPTILIYGTEDNATPVKYGELFHENIKDSELVVIDGADHFLHHAYSKDIQQIINEFLIK